MNSVRPIIGIAAALLCASLRAEIYELPPEGYDVIGITMKTYSFDQVCGNVGTETSCWLV